MKIHEQRDELAEAIRIALPFLSGGPTLGAFGIAREDCALAHIDYFGGIQSAAMHLLNALAETQGTTAPELARDLGLPTSRPCDCNSCVGPAEAAKAREQHKAAYTNVATWKEMPDA